MTLRPISSTAFCGLLLMTIWLSSCGEGGVGQAVNEVSSKRGNGEYSGMDKDDCILEDDSKVEGRFIFAAGDSLEAVARRSFLEGEDLYRAFDAESTSYSIFGNSAQLVFDSPYGQLDIPKVIAVEFIHTDKLIPEENRERVLSERIVKDSAARLLPLYTRFDCLMPDIEAYRERLRGLGFQKVQVVGNKSFEKILELFSKKGDMKGVLTYQFESWKRSDYGFTLSVTQARVNSGGKNVEGKFVYNLVIGMVLLTEHTFWQEIE